MNRFLLLLALLPLITPVFGADLNPNLRPHPTKPNCVVPIINFADPQEPLRSGPFCCDTPVMDFGRVTSDQNVHVVFSVTNEGDSTILVKATWGGTCAGMCQSGPLVLQPGEAGEYFRTVSMRNANGPIQTHLTLTVIAEFPETDE